MNIGPERENYFVNSLEKGLRVLRAFDSADKQLTLSMLAEKTGLNKATARRFALTLVDLGYLKLIPPNSKFLLTPKVLEFSDLYLKSNDLTDIAQPILEDLTERTGKSTNIAVLDGTDIVYISWVISKSNFINLNLRVGSRLPYYATAIGKAIVSWLPLEERIRLWEASTVKPFTEYTIYDFDQLEREIIEIKEKGYAVSNQEYSDGLLSLAIPLFNWEGNVIAAVNISNYSVKMDMEEFVNAYLLPLKESGKQISSLLGSKEK